MGTDDRLRVLQVYNISTSASNDLIKQLFQHFGRIDEFQVYLFQYLLELHFRMLLGLPCVGNSSNESKSCVCSI